LLYSFMLLAVATGCAAQQPVAPAGVDGKDVTLTLVGFTAGSSVQLRADAMAEAIRLEQPGWNVVSMAAGGEARLISKRLAGEADLYFPTSPRAVELAVQVPLHPGVEYEALTDYRIVMPSGLLVLQLLVREDSGFLEPSDLVLRRRPYVAGCGAGTMTLLLSRMFEYYGSSLDEAAAWGLRLEPILVPSAEGVDALVSGRIDVGMTWSGIPNSQFLGLTSGVRLLQIADAGLVQMFRDLGCVPAVVPAGTYPFVREDVATVGAIQPLVARADLDEDVVYAVARAVFDHADLITAAYPGGAAYLTPAAVAEAVDLSRETGVPFHPGALRFYREMGWVI